MKNRYWLYVLSLLLCAAGIAFIYGCGSNATGGGGGGGSVPTTHYFAYVANLRGHNVSAYIINSVTGSLESISGSPFDAGPYDSTTVNGPRGVAADPSGKYLYVTNTADNKIYAFRINAGTGSLDVVSGSPFNASTSPLGIVVDPTGKYLYVSNTAANNIEGYKIYSGTGSLEVLSSPTSAGNSPYLIAADPSGNYLYVANG